VDDQGSPQSTVRRPRTRTAPDQGRAYVARGQDRRGGGCSTQSTGLNLSHRRPCEGLAGIGRPWVEEAPHFRFLRCVRKDVDPSYTPVFVCHEVASLRALCTSAALGTRRQAVAVCGLGRLARVHARPGLFAYRTASRLGEQVLLQVAFVQAGGHDDQDRAISAANLLINLPVTGHFDAQPGQRLSRADEGSTLKSH
jgi:hypothetical protein